MKTLPCIALLLGACSAGNGAATADDANNIAATSADTPPQPPPAPVPSQAQAIHQSEETDRIDYELTIPAEAAALPRLREQMLAEASKAKAETLEQQADSAKEYPDSGAKTFGVQLNWRTAGQTDGLLSLVEDVLGFTGGAHGNAGTRPLIWDREADREVTLSELFTNRAKALATIRAAYCKALDAERLDKRGERFGADSGFADCPAWHDLTVAPFGRVGGKFSRILVIADPYVAGPWAEGDYEIELVIPKAMIPFVAPVYRTSFPG